MATTTTHGDKTRTQGNKYNLTPETARVGVQIGKVTSGVLHDCILYHGACEVEQTTVLGSWECAEDDSVLGCDVRGLSPRQ